MCIRDSDFGIATKEHQPGSDRLGEDAMGATDHGGVLMSGRLPSQRGQKLLIKTSDNDLGRLAELERQHGIKHIG